MEPPPSHTGRQPQPALRRTLGVFDGVALLIGITIGAGIYATPQRIAGYLSSFQDIILLWFLIGLFVFVGGLIYAELGTRLPHTGGEYVYLYRCFGPFVGFMFGWTQLFIIRTSPAAGLAIITVDYLEYFIYLSPLAQTMTAILIIAALGFLNYVGIQHASLYQKISTVIKVGGLFLLVLIGLVLAQGQPHSLSTEIPATAALSPTGNIIAAIMLIVFSYAGWDRVGYVAGEMKNPKRAIPRSLLYGLGTVIIAYLLTNFIYHYTLGMEGMRTSTIVASDVMTLLVGPTGAGMVAVLVMISATGSMNGTMMSAPRVYYAMARDGLFFKWLAYVHPTFRTPARAVLVHCGWAVVLLLIRGNFETIISGMVFAILIFYTLTTLALFKLRREQVGGDNVYTVPFYPFLPILYLVGLVVLVVLRAVFAWQDTLTDLAFIATGLPVSYFWLRKTGYVFKAPVA